MKRCGRPPERDLCWSCGDRRNADGCATVLSDPDRIQSPKLDEARDLEIQRLTALLELYRELRRALVRKEDAGQTQRQRTGNFYAAYAALRAVEEADPL